RAPSRAMTPAQIRARPGANRAAKPPARTSGGWLKMASKPMTAIIQAPAPPHRMRARAAPAQGIQAPAVRAASSWARIRAEEFRRSEKSVMTAVGPFTVATTRQQAGAAGSPARFPELLGLP